MEKIDIMGLSLSELEEAVVGIGEKKFRAKQIFQWLHVKRVFDFEKMTDISAQLRQELEKIESDISQAKAVHNEFLKELGLKLLP